MNKNIEELNNLLNKHFNKSKNSILSIGIKTSDKEFFYNWNTPKDNNEMYFGLGSVSKTIISTYICEMVDRKSIELDKTIDSYLKVNPKINYPKVIDLLTHTSGYHAFIPFRSSIWTLITKGFNKKNIYQNIDNEWLKNSLNKIRPFKKKRYRYSDYNFAVLALIIETIEKRPFKDVISDYMVNQLKMKNSFYATKEFSNKDDFSWIWEDDNPFLASGGMFSTVSDLLNFLDYQKSNQEKLMISHDKYHRTNLNKNIYTGFSWVSFYNGKFYWHIGGQGYYRSYILFNLKKDISIVILSTVDIDVQHVNRLGSSIHNNIKRNNELLYDFLQSYSTN
jgi:CubicO group peptidase (beta-lactamase class C family)